MLHGTFLWAINLPQTKLIKLCTEISVLRAANLDLIGGITHTKLHWSHKVEHHNNVQGMNLKLARSTGVLTSLHIEFLDHSCALNACIDKITYPNASLVMVAIEIL